MRPLAAQWFSWVWVLELGIEIAAGDAIWWFKDGALGVWEVVDYGKGGVVKVGLMG
jgi:hypothetical protein